MIAWPTDWPTILLTNQPTHWPINPNTCKVIVMYCGKVHNILPKRFEDLGPKLFAFAFAFVKMWIRSAFPFDRRQNSR